MLEPYLLGAAAVALAFFLLWLASAWRRDVSIVDIVWGPGFLLAVLVWRLLAEDGPLPDQNQASPVRWLYLGLVALWALRLALHIAWRHHGEDYRYRAMREKRGKTFVWSSLFIVFLLQALLVVVIALPHLWIQLGDRPDSLVATDWLALALFAVGFSFESVADWQLARFKADPANRGKVMRKGLWALSRHPNYFGEATLWWGFYAGALASAGGWMTLPSVLLMTVLLLKVSGVSLLESTIVERRPEYRDYIASTSAFLPIPRKSSSRL